MSVTPEVLAAFADGELDDLTSARVSRAIAADPGLAAQLEAHLALKAQLGAHFAPILAQPVPERLTEPLDQARKVVDFAAVRARRKVWQVPAWRFAGPALAACLVIALLIPRGDDAAPEVGRVASGALAQLLDESPSGATASAGGRILLSFRDNAGRVCRGYAGTAQSGIACHESDGWRIRVVAPGERTQTVDYRQAGSGAAEVMEAAQALAAGPAFDAAEEQAARANGWKPDGQ